MDDNVEVDHQLWYACAGRAVQVPRDGSEVCYFPEGHMEHVGSKINSKIKENTYICCRVSALKLLADKYSDEIFAKIRLVPASSEAGSEMNLVNTRNTEPEALNNVVTRTKVLSNSDTASDLLVPKDSVANIFPTLLSSEKRAKQPILARDIHGKVWTFTHTYREDADANLLTKGWREFSKSKGLVRGDKIVFVRVGNAISMLIVKKNSRRVWDGLLDHVVSLANQGMPFEVLYYPHAATPFCVESSLVKAAMNIEWRPGMKFEMAFSNEDSSGRFFHGTVRALRSKEGEKISPWRHLQVTWDSSLRTETSINPWLVKPLTHISTPLIQTLSHVEKLLGEEGPQVKLFGTNLSSGDTVSHFCTNGSKDGIGELTLSLGPSSSRQFGVAPQLMPNTGSSKDSRYELGPSLRPQSTQQSNTQITPVIHKLSHVDELLGEEAPQVKLFGNFLSSGNTSLQVYTSGSKASSGPSGEAPQLMPNTGSSTDSVYELGPSLGPQSTQQSNTHISPVIQKLSRVEEHLGEEAPQVKLFGTFLSSGNTSSEIYAKGSSGPSGEAHQLMTNTGAGDTILQLNFTSSSSSDSICELGLGLGPSSP